MPRGSIPTAVVIGLVAILIMLPRVLGAQSPSQTAPGLRIAGDVGAPLALTVTDLRAMPRSRVSLKSESGQTVAYEGVLAGELLKRAGAPVGNEFRGNAVSTYVVALATDGYEVVFSLAELDSAITSSRIIVADTADGQPLAANQGPLRIVVPDDSRAVRSIRMLERLDVVRLRK